MKTLIKIVMGGLGVVTAVAIAVAGYLIYPGTPSSASSLTFQGYVPLPSDGLLSVLDYLTVYDDKLFVTSESTGDVYRVPSPQELFAHGRRYKQVGGRPCRPWRRDRPLESSCLCDAQRSEYRGRL